VLAAIRLTAGRSNHEASASGRPRRPVRISSHTRSIHARSSSSGSVGFSRCPRPCSEHLRKITPPSRRRLNRAYRFALIARHQSWRRRAVRGSKFSSSTKFWQLGFAMVLKERTGVPCP